MKYFSIIITKDGNDNCLKILDQEKIIPIYAYRSSGKMSIKIKRPDQKLYKKILDFDWVESLSDI